LISDADSSSSKLQRDYRPTSIPEARPSILFLTGPVEDFLADSLLHGLRSLLGTGVVDFPRCRLLDASLPSSIRDRMHGRGFTLYGTLPDEEGDAVDRTDVWDRARAGEFHTIVFSSIWRQQATFLSHKRTLTPANTVFLDGEDSPNLFPFSGEIIRSGGFFLFPRVYSSYRYFKRELTTDSIRSTWYFLLPAKIASLLSSPQTVQPISFSVPATKVVSAVPAKTRQLCRHCVDEEVAGMDSDLSTVPLFTSEDMYYGELQASRFAVTTKRAGWDCLRHYEIAANGCVPCFRDLDKKPALCAPHGLDESNCVSYSSATDLFGRLKGIGPSHYAALATNALKWAKRNTTIMRASEFLNAIGFPYRVESAGS
jgi:hypothetical protein